MENKENKEYPRRVGIELEDQQLTTPDWLERERPVKKDGEYPKELPQERQ